MHPIPVTLRFVCMLLIVGLTWTISGSARANTATEEAFVPNQIVVKLTQPSDLVGVASDYQLTLIDQFGVRPIYQLQITDGAPPVEKVAALLNDPQGRVLFAEPNYVGQTPEGRQRSAWTKGEQSEYQTQWAPITLRLAEAHATTRGAGVTVAVLDTGVDPTHEALAGKLVGGYDFVDNDRDPREEGVYGTDAGFGHGTHVAGLVALSAPEANIMPLRVLNPQGEGNIWVLAEALDFAVNPDGDPSTPDGAQIINLSLSFTRPSDLLEQIVSEVTCGAPGDDDDDVCGDDDDDDNDRDDDEGKGKNKATRRTPTGQRGVVVVAAAGNSASTIREYPAGEGVPGLLAVGASTPADTLATFSNRGSWVQIVAPGEAILSSVPGNSYGAWSGTSMATPLVAGTAALVRSIDPQLTSLEVTQRLTTTAQRIRGVAPHRLDAAAAVGQ